MTSKVTINDFILQSSLAVVGISRNTQKFGNMAYRELRAKGYKLFPIHPEAETLEGDHVYKDFTTLPEKVGGILVVISPIWTEAVVREAAEAGINRVWMQQGAESQAAIQFCLENGIAEVHGECILMYAGKAGFHKVHRWLWKMIGKAPK